MANSDTGSMYDRLIEAIEREPTPGAPPKMSLTGAGIGLSFLQTVLGQKHTKRLTEDLVFGRVGVVTRTVRQQISLAALTRKELDASKRYAEHSSRTGRTNREIHNTGFIWIPLARLDRRKTPPVLVTEDGNFVATLTRGESSQLFSQAICRLMTSILNANTKCETTTAAKWLLEQTIDSLVVGRAPASNTRTDRQQEGPCQQPPRADRPETACLKRALEALLLSGTLNPVLDLLQVAVDEQVLIASVNTAHNDHEFSYSVPVTIPPPAKRRRGGVRQWLPRFFRKCVQVLCNNQDYIVRYDTYIPSGVHSYHLTAKAEDGSPTVRDAILAVRSRNTQVDHLKQDLLYAANQLELENGHSESAHTSRFRGEAGADIS